MTILNKPFGVVAIHQHFRGFLDLCPNTIYSIESADLHGAVVLVEHVRPLIVTDFNNELTMRQLADRRSYVDIKRPISEISIDSMSAHGSGFEGRKAPVVAIEIDPAGRAFCQDIYSTLQVMWEIADEVDAQKMGAYLPLLDRFIATYCFLFNDPRIRINGGIPEESNPTRIGYFRYTDAEKAMPFHERMNRVRVDKWQLYVAGMGRGANALQDHKGGIEASKDRSTHLGSYLCNGFAPSENLTEVHRLCTQAIVDRRPKASIVEAMSVLETALHHQHRTLCPKKAQELAKKSEPVGWKFLMNAILPALLNFYDGDKTILMKRADKARLLRHAVVHSGYVPTMEDADMILSFVRHVLCIFELPEAVKGEWKRKVKTVKP